MPKLSHPTVVIVGGAFHKPSHYAPVIGKLGDAGYKATGVDIPSTGPAPRAGGLDADIVAVRIAVESECDAGHEVIVVVHSAGGVSGSAALEGLSKPLRQDGGVIRIVAIAAFLIKAGTDLMTASGGQLADWYYLIGDMLHPQPYDHARSAAEVLFHDCPDDVKRKAFDDLVPQGFAAMNGVVPYAGWTEIPLTYIVCERDRAFPAPAQEALTASLGVPVDVQRIESGHCPFLSSPEEVANIIRRAAGEKF